MPVVAPHHSPYHFLPSDTDYVPVCAWPDDCYVQWGAPQHFVLESGKTHRAAAFFEAFPSKRSNNASMIRGEGDTIEAAERAAFAKFLRFAGCPGHQWVRGKYINGCGACRHCGAWSSDAFPSWEPTDRDLDRLTPTDLEAIMLGLIQPRARQDRLSRFDPVGFASKIRRLVLKLKAKRAGLALPDLNLDEDSYSEACAATIARWWDENRGRYADGSYPDYQLALLDDNADVHARRGRYAHRR